MKKYVAHIWLIITITIILCVIIIIYTNTVLSCTEVAAAAATHTKNKRESGGLSRRTHTIWIIDRSRRVRYLYARINVCTRIRGGYNTYIHCVDHRLYRLGCKVVTVCVYVHYILRIILWRRRQESARYNPLCFQGFRRVNVGHNDRHEDDDNPKRHATHTSIVLP